MFFGRKELTFWQIEEVSGIYEFRWWAVTDFVVNEKGDLNSLLLVGVYGFLRNPEATL